MQRRALRSTPPVGDDPDGEVAVAVRRLDLDGFMPYRLNVLASLVSRALARIYAERHGITIPEWRVLATLGQHDEMTATAIGHHTHMHKTKVSRAVSVLAARRLIARSASPVDRREARLRLTPKGRMLYAELVPAARAFERELLAGLDGDDREALIRLTTRLIRRAEELGGAAGEGRGRPDGKPTGEAD